MPDILKAKREADALTLHVAMADRGSNPGDIDSLSLGGDGLGDRVSGDACMGCFDDKYSQYLAMS